MKYTINEILNKLEVNFNTKFSHRRVTNPDDIHYFECTIYDDRYGLGFRNSGLDDRGIGNLFYKLGRTVYAVDPERLINIDKKKFISLYGKQKKLQ